ncbi:MAG: hypothetical protein FWC11_06280 [Firmicutes bacterium]|nr:hypothetical protein [Bacillota bacterium]MCL2256437.1 hypothetical protein [Bacillota bacterium]
MVDIFGNGIIPLWAYILSQVFGLITAGLVFYTFAFIGSKPKGGEKVTCEAEKKALDLKHQQKRFTWLAIWAATWLVMFVFLGQFTGILLAGFAFLRNIIFRITIGSQNKKVKIFSKAFLGLSLVIGIVAAILPHFIFPTVYVGWLDVLVLVGATIYILSTYLPNKHFFNGATIHYSIWLILLAVAAMNVPVEGFSYAVPAEYIAGRGYGTTFWGMFSSARYIEGYGYNHIWSNGLPNFAGMAIEVIKIGAVAVFYFFWFFKGGRKNLTVQKEDAPVNSDASNEERGSSSANVALDTQGAEAVETGEEAV